MSTPIAAHGRGGDGDMKPAGTILGALARIADEIRREHGAAVDAATTALQHACRAGALLVEAKAHVPHGQWLPWLREHCPAVSEQQAQRYMRISRGWTTLQAKSVTVTDLTQREALALLAAGPRSPGDTSPVPWHPPAGCACFIEDAPSNGESVDVLIYPSQAAGFWYVTVLRRNVLGERWAVADGTKKAIRGDRLGRFLAQVRAVDVDLATAAWTPDVDPWVYNEVLFDSEEQWREHWLHGTTAVGAGDTRPAAGGWS